MAAHFIKALRKIIKESLLDLDLGGFEKQTGVVPISKTQLASMKNIADNLDEIYKGLRQFDLIAPINETINGYQQEVNEAKNWFNNFKSKLQSELSEPLNCLWILLYAACSVRTNSETNEVEANALMVAFLQDIELSKKRKKLDWYTDEINKNRSGKAVFDESDDSYEANGRSDTSDSVMPCTFVGEVFKRISVSGSKKNNVFNIFSMYMSKGGKINKTDTVKLLASGVNLNVKAGSMALTKPDALLQRQKVLNFAINLLDPDFRFENGWYPVTVDVWVFRFMYPFIHTSKIGELQKNPTYHLYAQKVLNSISQEIQLKPQELQSLIWTYMILTHPDFKSISSLKQVEGRIKQMLQKVKESKQGIEIINKKMASVDKKFDELFSYSLSFMKVSGFGVDVSSVMDQCYS